MLLAFEGVIRVHQNQYFRPAFRPRPLHGIVFSSIRRSNADESIKNCIKFFLNYAFYKFGLEVGHARPTF